MEHKSVCDAGSAVAASSETDPTADPHLQHSNDAVVDCCNSGSY